MLLSIIGVIILAGGTFWLDAPSLIKAKHYRELIVFIILLTLSASLYAALVMNIKFPNPLSVLKPLYSGLGLK